MIKIKNIKKIHLIPISLFLFYISAFASTLVVDAHPSHALFFQITCENTTNGYLTIQDAINDAAENDTISICDATYNEKVTISTNNLTIKRSDDADENEDVIVKNSNNVFTINGVNNLTISTLLIKHTDDKNAIYIKAYSENILIQDTNITSDDGNGIKVKEGIGYIELKNIRIEAHNYGVYFKKTIDNGLSISDSNITSKAQALDFKKDVSGLITITNSTIESTENDAIDFKKKINDGITLDNVTLNSKSYAIKIKGKITKEMKISNSKITSKNSGAIKIDEKINDGIIISNSEISAKNNGFTFEKDISGDINISNISITSGSNGIYFKGKLNNGIEIKDSDINSTSAKGIYFLESVNNFCTIDNVHISSSDRGLYFNEKQIEPTITNSTIISSDSNAIYTKNNDGSKFTLKDSCVESKKSDKYALWINNNSTNAEVSGNCFYATAINKLGKAKKSGNDVSGNYWDENSGDYTYNHINDTNTLASCPNSCDSGGANTLALLVNYRMDECSWDGSNNEVEDSSGNSYHATAKNGADTTTGKLCKAGDINATASDDKAILPSNNIPLPSSYTLTVWVKFPLNEDGHKIFNSGGDKYIYFNIADKPGSDNDYIYFEKKNDSWSLCLEGDNYECKSYNPQSLSGWHQIAFKVSDDGTDYYLDGTEKLNFSQHPNEGGLGLIMNSDYDNSQDNKSNKQSIGTIVDEFKIFSKVLTDAELTTIYNNEQDGKNYDGAVRTCNGCGNGGGQTNHQFDAWDTFRDINDRNISTKIVSQEFKIFVASFNQTGDDYQEFNGTVCSCLDSKNCFKNLFKDVNNSEQTDEGDPTFTINNANNEIKVDIHWKENVDTSCPLMDEDNSTNASDSFALRPKKFLFTLPTELLYAGETFQLDFNATDETNNNTIDFNETIQDTFEVNATIIKEGCNIGTFELTDFSFSDGSATSIDTNYTNIGDLNISIQEKDTCSDKYASIDCDDKEVTNYWNVDNNLSIEPFNRVLNIRPYELNITTVEMQTSTNTDWLYMANIDDMNLSFFTVVQANNKQHERLDDFNSTCYAEDVNIGFGVDVLNGNDDLDMNATVIVNDNRTLSNFLLQDINKTITISKDFFITGEGNASYFLNVNRNYSDPVNPFKIKDLNVTIETENVAKYENNAIDDNNSFIFYFARVSTDDKETTDTNVSHFSEIEIYDNNNSEYVANFKQNSLNWYANAKHNNSFISLIEIDGSKKSTLNNSEVLITISSFDTNTNKVNFNISNSDEGTYRMHTKIKPWFWYFPAGLGQKYNDSDGSDCTEHPCFDYILKTSDSTPSGVVSGDFTGSDYNVSSRGTYQKTGIKVFR